MEREERGERKGSEGLVSSLFSCTSGDKSSEGFNVMMVMMVMVKALARLAAPGVGAFRA